MSAIKDSIKKITTYQQLEKDDVQSVLGNFGNEKFYAYNPLDFINLNIEKDNCKTYSLETDTILNEENVILHSFHGNMESNSNSTDLIKSYKKTLKN